MRVMKFYAKIKFLYYLLIYLCFKIYFIQKKLILQTI
jgi:hypothetical protein